MVKLITDAPYSCCENSAIWSTVTFLAEAPFICNNKAYAIVLAGWCRVPESALPSEADICAIPNMGQSQQDFPLGWNTD